MNANRHFLLLFFLLHSAVVFALDARAELVRINQQYAAAKGCSMNMSIAVYEKAEDTEPMQRFSGEMRRRSDAYYTSLMGQTTLMNANCQLVIDESRKVIYFDSRNAKEKQFRAPQADLSGLLDSALLPSSQLKLLAISAIRNTLEVTATSPSPVKRTVIHYHPVSLVILEVIYYYDTSDKDAIAKAVITYSAVLLGAEPDAALFSEKQFVVRKGNQWQPAPRWAGYQVIDITPQLTTPN